MKKIQLIKLEKDSNIKNSENFNYFTNKNNFIEESK